MCPTGFALKQDGRTCEDSKFFLSTTFHSPHFLFYILMFIYIRYLKHDIILLNGKF